MLIAASDSASNRFLRLLAVGHTAEHHQLPLATLNLKHFPMFPKLSAAY
jgi:predicted nucleic acid-binding protein